MNYNPQGVISNFENLLEYPILDGIDQCPLSRWETQSIYDRKVTYEHDTNAADNTCELKPMQVEESLTTSDHKNQSAIREESLITYLSDAQNSETVVAEEIADIIVEEAPDMVKFNIEIAIKKRNSMKKSCLKNRLLDLFFPKFKQFVRDQVLYHYPEVRSRSKEFSEQLSNLPGMKKCKNIRSLKELLQIKTICGLDISLLQLAREYLESNISVLDCFFPLENSNGQFRRNRFGNESTENYISFLPIYEMMIKLQDAETEKNKNKKDQECDISFQNIWYYADTAQQMFEPFDMEE